jgi:hypothetical protein
MRDRILVEKSLVKWHLGIWRGICEDIIKMNYWGICREGGTLLELIQDRINGGFGVSGLTDRVPLKELQFFLRENEFGRSRRGLSISSYYPGRCTSRS